MCSRASSPAWRTRRARLGRRRGRRGGRAARGALRPTRTRCSRGSPPSIGIRRASASSPPTSPCAARPVRRCRSAPPRTFLGDLEPVRRTSRTAPAWATRSTARRASGSSGCAAEKADKRAAPRARCIEGCTTCPRIALPADPRRGSRSRCVRRLPTSSPDRRRCRVEAVSATTAAPPSSSACEDPCSRRRSPR